MVLIAAYWALLLIGTPIALIDYFNRAWPKLDSVPNKGAYIVWLSLESVAGAGFLATLFYATIARCRRSAIAVDMSRYHK